MVSDAADAVVALGRWRGVGAIAGLGTTELLLILAVVVLLNQFAPTRFRFDDH